MILCSSHMLIRHRTQAILKGIVDETSFGKYDFMYLRMGMISASSLKRNKLLTILRRLCQ